LVHTPLVVVAVLPHFTADRVTRASEGRGMPFATVVSERGRRVLVDTGRDADGVRAGMTLSEARAILPSLDAVDIDLNACAREHAWLARVCQRRFAPKTGLLGDRGIWIDARGAAHLFGGVVPLLDGVVDLFDRLGYRVRVACGATAGEAWALAAFATPDGDALVGGAPAATLAPLPVAALRLDTDTTASLRELGVRTIGDLLALERAAVAARFGSAVARRVDEVTGRLDEKLIAIEAIGRIVAAVDFAGSTDRQDAVLFGLRRLTNAFEALLGAAGLAARTIVLTMARAGASDPPPPATRITLPCSAPTTTAESFFALLRERVERVDLTDPVVSLSLEATDTTAHQPRQLRLFESADGPDERLGTLRDRLAARFGDDAVHLPRYAETHIPEDRIGSTGAESAAPDPARPATLLARPLPIEVTVDTASTMPTRIRGGGVDGAIIACRGPERIVSNWWAAETARDYYEVVLADGRHVWVFLNRLTGEWRLHGLF
jgi:protein ImuB